MSRKNAKKGKALQREIVEDCLLFERQGYLHIAEIPDPFKVFQYDGPTVTGVFESPVEVDFSGTLQGGRSIVFEAKYCSNEHRFSFRLLETRGDKHDGTRQRDLLRRHAKLGAVAFVLVRRPVDAEWSGWKTRDYIFPVAPDGTIADTPDSERRSIRWDQADEFKVPRGRSWFWHVVELYGLEIERGRKPSRGT